MEKSEYPSEAEVEALSEKLFLVLIGRPGKDLLDETSVEMGRRYWTVATALAEGYLERRYDRRRNAK